MIRTEHELQWRRTAHATRLLVLAAAATLLGLAFGRPEVAALAAVPLAYLWRRRSVAPAQCEVQVAVDAPTSFEDEPVPASVRIVLAEPVDVAVLDVLPARWVEWTGRIRSSADTTLVESTGDVIGRRWGRRRLGEAVLRLVADSGLAAATVTLDLGELPVLPQPAPVRGLTVVPLRGGLAGDHRARRSGAGVEFAGIRPYAPGDSPARVHWPISLRMQQLHVTERVAEESVDVVLVIDAFTDVGAPGRSSRDLSVRGATGVALALLRSHDRVGVVALGGRLRWLRPDNGTRQFYRIAAATLDVIDRESYVDPDLGVLPPRAVPAGAHVILFSPLLDLRVVPAIEALRLRGVLVTVVDVLTSRPAPANPVDELALRLWLLQREGLTARLAGLGVVIVCWDGSASLGARLGPVLSGRRVGVAR